MNQTIKKSVQEITLDDIKELIPEKVTLYYVDYREGLDNMEEEIEKCIHDQTQDALFEKVDEAFQDSPSYAFEYLDKELKSDIERKYDLDEDEVNEVFEKYKDDIRDIYYDRDDNTVMEDLWRNTGNMVMCYNTGYEMECDSWAWDDKKINQEIKAMKKYLGIKDDSANNALRNIILDAGYGGELCICFSDNPKKYIELHLDLKTIVFDNPMLAVIDRMNGSGSNYEVNSTIKLPFNPKNIILDSIHKYSYTNDICGMSRDWCDCTQVSFEKKKSRKKLGDSATAKQIEQEAKYQKIYDEGGCSFGDIRFERHRDTYYRNEYPCGTKCPHCGRFWID